MVDATQAELAPQSSELSIGPFRFASRLFVGTGKYRGKSNPDKEICN